LRTSPLHLNPQTNIYKQEAPLFKMVKNKNWIWFIVFLIFGAYFINAPFNFVPIPASMDVVNNWIIFIGGILIVIGGINFLRLSKKY
jgi:hypothetical protein